MYPTDTIYPLVFNFTETESMHEKFENLGYEGSNFVELQGSGLITLIISFFNSLSIIFLIYLCKRCFKYYIFRYIAIKLPTFNPYAMVLRVFIETYLEFMFSAIISIAAMYRPLEPDTIEQEGSDEVLRR